MAEVLRINGYDYTKYIQQKGVEWSRDDLDGENAGRTLDGVMHRDKIASKKNLSYKLMEAPQSVLARLDTALSEDTVSVTYSDLHGTKTKTFYCSSFKATLETVDSDGTEVWGDASFNLHEV